MSSRAAALGFAPHSGWAAVVAVAEEGGRPRVLLRDRIEMVDPGDGEAKQPYHAVEDAPVAEARKRLARYAAAAEAKAHASLKRIVGRLGDDGHRASGVGILDSMGRKVTDLEAVLASHALIHGADGDHFREAIAAAAARCGLPVLRIPARDLGAQAASRMGLSMEDMQETVKALGREWGPPWGADQKAAALLAWLVLEKG